MQVCSRQEFDASEKAKKQLCAQCAAALAEAQSHYGFEIADLAFFTDSALEDALHALVASEPKEAGQLQYMGWPVGGMAQYDFALERKRIYDAACPEEESRIYFAYVRGAAMAVALSDRLCKAYQPGVVVTFNEYTHCQGARAGAAQNGIPWRWTTHASILNVDASRVMLGRGSSFYWYFSHCQGWKSVRHIPAPADAIDLCWRDAVFRASASGSHIYSSSKSGDPRRLFEKLGLDPARKLLVVYTSSFDERFGLDMCTQIWGESTNPQDAFPDQIAWLQFLRGYARSRDDVQIVVRIHPREGVNKNYSFASEHLTRLQEAFSENDPYFIVVWPEDPVSSYDLAELAHASLTAWSTMGPELARMGIPGLASTTGFFAPDDIFLQAAGTVEEYIRRLDALIAMEYTWEHLLGGVRFFHWYQIVSSLHLGPAVPASFEEQPVWPHPTKEHEEVLAEILSGKEDSAFFSIREWQAGLPVEAEAQEREAMCRGIRVLLDALFFPPVSNVPAKRALPLRILRRLLNMCFAWRPAILQDKQMPKEPPFLDYQLEFSSETEKTPEYIARTMTEPSLRILVAQDDCSASLIRDGKVFNRMSPLAIHLARLAHSRNGINPCLSNV
jgi:hypothetical protein